uniref:T4 RNA ligase 1-like N-terminal domain-containing protein n=1 Tax=viral metagenome TaxID=1070528 RepID=A0A6C0LJV7_9ZZZZ
MISDTPFINLNTIPGLVDFLNDESTNYNDVLKLNKVFCKSSEDAKYSIISYNKKFLSFDLVGQSGLFRSVIMNANNNIVSYSPSKSFDLSTFTKMYPDNSDQSLVAEEFIEGTMINVFWNPLLGLSGGWEIATRNNVGANCSFFKHNSSKSKSFREMFLEAAKENHLIIDKLNTECCFSFVLQHPDNRIVIPVKNPQLYLVACYSIDHSDSDNGDIFIYNVPLNNLKNYDWDSTTIQFPKVYTFTNYNELTKMFDNNNSPYDIMGLVIKNLKSDSRTIIRNPVYEEVKMLRGNQPKLQFQYLELRKQRKVKEYLLHFGEHKEPFNQFKTQLHQFTKALYNNYKSCYIYKAKPLKEFSPQFRTHMFNVHKIYVSKLMEQKKFVDFKLVIEFVNNLDTSLLMHSLNYHLLQRNSDEVKAEFYGFVNF